MERKNQIHKGTIHTSELETGWPAVQITETVLQKHKATKHKEEPPTTKKIVTDSEEDPEYNQEEFLRLRSSLHRRIDEAEAQDRATRNSKQPCGKIRKFFRRMFTDNATKPPDDAEEVSKKVESVPTCDVSKLKSPSSDNQILGEPFLPSCSSDIINGDDNDIL